MKINIDAGYQWRAIGALFIILAVVTMWIGNKINITPIIGIGILSLFGGLIIAWKGMTLISIPNNPSYENYLRRTAKVYIWLIPVILLLMLLAVITSLVLNLTNVTLVIFIIAFTGLLYLGIRFWVTVLKATSHGIKSLK